MNCEQAKEQVRIQDFLNNLTIQPTRFYGRFLWYKSPLPYRKDENPSFRIDTKTNYWLDVGTGETGNIIDLVMKMNFTDVAGALEIISKPQLSKKSFSFSKQQKYQNSFQIKHLQLLQNRALIHYLTSRQISQSKAVNYVQEAYYCTYPEQKKPFFALAFKNDKGGFELRSGVKTKNFPDGFKGSISPKVITTIPGNRKAINLFEGFIDFLSALEYHKISKPCNTTIVLNSVTNLDSIIELLKGFNQINLFLDNDEAGELAGTKIKNVHSRVKDYSKIIYPGNKDFNEFICKNQLS
ncbi:MAG: toprim domain-containing protein [bacterium]